MARAWTVERGISAAVVAGVTIFMYAVEGVGGAAFGAVVTTAAFVLAGWVTRQRAPATDDRGAEDEPAGQPRRSLTPARLRRRLYGGAALLSIVTAAALLVRVATSSVSSLDVVLVGAVMLCWLGAWLVSQRVE